MCLPSASCNDTALELLVERPKPGGNSGEERWGGVVDRGKYSGGGGGDGRVIDNVTLLVRQGCGTGAAWYGEYQSGWLAVAS